MLFSSFSAKSYLQKYTAIRFKMSIVDIEFIDYMNF